MSSLGPKFSFQVTALHPTSNIFPFDLLFNGFSDEQRLKKKNKTIKLLFKDYRYSLFGPTSDTR